MGAARCSLGPPEIEATALDAPLLSLGETCALLAPLAWAIAVILFRKASSLPAETMNFFKNSLALVMLGLTMAVMGIQIPWDRPYQDWISIAGSGVLGLAFADTMLFIGLSRVGASRLAVVDTVYAPTIMLISSVFLGEQLSHWFLVGAMILLGGVALASIEKRSIGGDLTPSQRRGLLYCWVAITSTATGVVLVKPVLEHENLIEITWSRLLFGLIGQTLYMLLRGQLQGTLRQMTQASVWKAMLPASIMGTWISLLLWLGGFKWAPASVAAVLNQMATVYILILARIFLKETIRPQQALGALLAAAGALFIILTRGL